MSEAPAVLQVRKGWAGWLRRGGAVRLWALPALAAVGVVQKQQGFFIGLIVPSLLLVAGLHAYWVWRGEVSSNTTWRRLAPWLAVVVAGLAVHVWYRTEARAAGDAAVGALEHFRAATGRFPETLDETGIEAAAWRRAPGLSYRNDAHGPELTYPSTFVPFDHYVYDFTAQRWRYVSGAQ